MRWISEYYWHNIDNCTVIRHSSGLDARCELDDQSIIFFFSYSQSFQRVSIFSFKPSFVRFPSSAAASSAQVLHFAFFFHPPQCSGATCESLARFSFSLSPKPMSLLRASITWKPLATNFRFKHTSAKMICLQTLRFTFLNISIERLFTFFLRFDWVATFSVGGHKMFAGLVLSSCVFLPVQNQAGGSQQGGAGAGDGLDEGAPVHPGLPGGAVPQWPALQEHHPQQERG